MNTIGTKLWPDFDRKAISIEYSCKRKSVFLSAWRGLHYSQLGCKSAFERPIWKRLNESNFSFGSINPPCVVEQTHLDDPVLWRPPPLPLEHRVNVGGHRHHHRLWLPPCIHVPLLCVLVDLVMVKTSEGHICGQDHLRALILQEKWTLISFQKIKINAVKTNVSSPHRPLSLGTPAVRAGQTWMMGTHCSRVFTASGYTTQVYKPPHCISCPLPASDGDERYDDIDGHICIPSQRILSLSLTDALLSICKSVPLGQTNQSTLPGWWWYGPRSRWGRELFLLLPTIDFDPHPDDTNLFASQVYLGLRGNPTVLGFIVSSHRL